MRIFITIFLCLFLPIQVTAQTFDIENCYSWAEFRLRTDLPSMETIAAAAEKRMPQKGDVAYFYYEKSGLPHVGVIEYVFDDGSFYLSETNMPFYHTNWFGVRYIPAGYKNFKGVYTPR